MLGLEYKLNRKEETVLMLHVFPNISTRLKWKKQSKYSCGN